MWRAYGSRLLATFLLPGTAVPGFHIPPRRDLVIMKPGVSASVQDIPSILPYWGFHIPPLRGFGPDAPVVRIPNLEPQDCVW